MKRNKAFARAIAIVGSQAKMAKEVGVSQPAVFYWLHESGVPADHAEKVERATDGHVTKTDLRPDIWPEPVATE